MTPAVRTLSSVDYFVHHYNKYARTLLFVLRFAGVALDPQNVSNINGKCECALLAYRTTAATTDAEERHAAADRTLILHDQHGLGRLDCGGCSSLGYLVTQRKRQNP